MVDEPTTHVEQELADLRDEVRRLREQQQKKQNGKQGQESEKKSEDNKKQEDNKDGEGGKHDEENQKKPWSPLKKAIVIGLAVVIAIVGILWWLHARRFENTDDAQVDGHTSPVASRIAGTVVAVYVEENQFVKAGQVIADLDPRDFKIAQNLALHQWQQAQAQVGAEQPNIQIGRA